MSKAASAARNVSRGVTSSTTRPVGIVYGKSAARSMFVKRTSIGSSASLRAIASMVPSMIQLVIAIGARMGPLPHLLVSTIFTSKA